MVITGIYANVFENSNRYTAQVNIGCVAEGNTGNSILSKVMDRTQPVHFFTLARHSFNAETDAEQYAAKKKAELENLKKEYELIKEQIKKAEEIEDNEKRKNTIKNLRIKSKNTTWYQLLQDFTQNARLVTFTSDKPIRTRNQKRFGIPADHNKFGDRYTIRRVYHKDLHGDFSNYIETVLGTVPEDHEIRENGERITVLLHSAVNVENADKVVTDLIDLVEDQEVA